MVIPFEDIGFNPATLDRYYETWKLVYDEKTSKYLIGFNGFMVNVINRGAKAGVTRIYTIKGQKRYYQTNLPCITLGDFEEELNRLELRFKRKEV